MHGLVSIGHGRGKEMSDGTSELARAMTVKKTPTWTNQPKWTTVEDKKCLTGRVSLCGMR